MPNFKNLHTSIILTLLAIAPLAYSQAPGYTPPPDDPSPPHTSRTPWVGVGCVESSGDLKIFLADDPAGPTDPENP